MSFSKKERPELRPLTGRALRTIRDTLRPDFPGCQVLDLYSGTGRFGLVALEEQASQVTMVEKRVELVREIVSLAKPYSPKAEVICADALQFLEGMHQQARQFDIVFADPPFRFWDEEFACALFDLVFKVLFHGAIFLVRYPKKVVASLPMQECEIWKTTKLGESQVVYLRGK